MTAESSLPVILRQIDSPRDAPARARVVADKRTTCPHREFHNSMIYQEARVLPMTFGSVAPLPTDRTISENDLVSVARSFPTCTLQIHSRFRWTYRMCSRFIKIWGRVHVIVTLISVFPRSVFNKSKLYLRINEEK